MKPGLDLGNVLDGHQWKQMIGAGAQALQRRKQEVDALNVFPVPDGDTGTNMHLTIQSAARDVEKTSGNSVAEVLAAASMGSLMGARGNSGVILSQLLRGIAKGFDGLTTSNASQIAQALQAGVDTAYKAVMKPVEGTILTVSREVARGALNKAKQGASPLETLREGYLKGQETLARTPDLLPILKQAGVVDAGGQGFLIILSGWIATLEGTGVAEFQLEQPQAEPVFEQQKQEFVLLENLDYPYCTEFLVKGSDLRDEQIREDLTGRGDCLLVVGTPEVIKIHIHTKNPGKILDYAIQWGSLHEVQIHNMLEQNEAMAHAGKEETAGPAEEQLASVSAGTGEGPIVAASTKEHGIVAVAMGEGIEQVLKSLGVDEVVLGGQTMNPSTEDLAEAVRKVPARNVYILPNNGNIVMAARQVQHVISDQAVHVIPTKSIPQGIAALIGFTAEGDEQENLLTMEKALGQVASGEVTYAVRDSQFGELNIAEGDVLGLIEGNIATTGRDLLIVAQATLEKMNWREHDLVTIFYGQETTTEQVEGLQDWLAKESPGVEIEVYPGGQPLYYYIFGVE